MPKYSDLTPAFQAMASSNWKLKAAGAAALAGIALTPYLVRKAKEGGEAAVRGLGRSTERAIGDLAGQAVYSTDKAVRGLFKKDDD